MNFSKEEKAMLSRSVDMMVKSLERASKGKSPEFQELYAKEVALCRKLEVTLASL